MPFYSGVLLQSSVHGNGAKMRTPFNENSELDLGITGNFAGNTSITIKFDVCAYCLCCLSHC